MTPVLLTHAQPRISHVEIVHILGGIDVGLLVIPHRGVGLGENLQDSPFINVRARELFQFLVVLLVIVQRLVDEAVMLGGDAVVADVAGLG